MLLTLLIYVLVFVLIWWLISIVPMPEPVVKFKWVFYAILVVVALVFLLRLI